MRPMECNTLCRRSASVGSASSASKRLRADREVRTATLLASLEVKAAVALEKLGTAGQAPDPDQQVFSQTPLGDSVNAFNSASNGFKAGTAFEDGAYLQALSNIAQIVASIWSKSPDWTGRTMLYGKDAVNIAADIYEAQALLFQQAKLIETQIALQQELSRLEAKDPEKAAQWHQILSNLYGDPAAQH